jgi:exopolysaccharide biosynthesis WecB/TagA/CpsF family protein
MEQRATVSKCEHRVASLSAAVNKIEVIGSEADEAKVLARVARTDGPLVVSFINQHSMILAWRSPAFASCLARSDLLFRDGIGVELCLSALGRSAGRNMCGTDFIPRIAAALAGRTTALFGTAEPWTGRAASALETLGCRIVSQMDGFKSEADYVTEVMRTAPELIILAMGSPKQEFISAAIASSATRPLVIVNGGAIADNLALRFARAPLWLRRARCEWAFRLLQEPTRLWRRYLLGSFSFVWCIVRLRMAP